MGLIGLAMMLTLNSIKSCIAVETTLPDMLNKIKPSVVAIGTFQATRIPRELIIGTGFGVYDGHYVVTNAHVIEKSLDGSHLESYAIYYQQNNKRTMSLADIYAIDEAHDLAVLVLKDENKLPSLELGESQKVREGETYAFTGYPLGQILGLFPVTHRGIISAITLNAIPAIVTQELNYNMVKRLQSPYYVFQLDATAFPGNSGSPLYNESTGKVVGIINKVFVQNSKENALTNPSGISYAIPSEYIKMLLIQKGLK